MQVVLVVLLAWLLAYHNSTMYFIMHILMNLLTKSSIFDPVFMACIWHESLA
jgi:hypothetical protein